ncbi:MAG TPA: hypothetical protein VLW55_22325 [Burkholderiaceae bacterium]|nr:hypothetical protein [Burkholderiaceae bacterium]
MKRNEKHTIRASLALAAAVIVAALSGCTALGSWNHANEQDSLAVYGGPGGDGSSGDGGSGSGSGTY